MTRYHLTLHSRAQRIRAAQLVEASPPGTRVEFKAEKRSMPQNDKMWALLTEVALQVKWHDQWLRPDDWKLIFLDGLKRETRRPLVRNLDDTGFVDLNRSSSDLTKGEMGDLIEVIYAFGANHNVQFKEEAA